MYLFQSQSTAKKKLFLLLLALPLPLFSFWAFLCLLESLEDITSFKVTSDFIPWTLFPLAFLTGAWHTEYVKQVVFFFVAIVLVCFFVQTLHFMDAVSLFVSSLFLVCTLGRFWTLGEALILLLLFILTVVKKKIPAVFYTLCFTFILSVGGLYVKF